MRLAIIGGTGLTALNGLACSGGGGLNGYLGAGILGYSTRLVLPPTVLVCQ